MKETLSLPLLLSLAIVSCTKPDDPSLPAPTARTERVKTLRMIPADSTAPGQYIEYQFYYSGSSTRLDSLVLYGSPGTPAFTTVYERHPTYFLRRQYDNTRRVVHQDSTVVNAQGQPLTSYYFGLGQPPLSITSFQYDGSARLTLFNMEFINLPGLPGTQTTFEWHQGDITHIYGDDLRLVGTYTYDASQPGQPADYLALHYLVEWGEPLLQNTHQMTGWLKADTIPQLSNFVYANGLLQQYDLPAARYVITYY